MNKYLRSNEFVPHATKNEGTIHINHSGCPAGEDRKKRLYITRKRDGSIVAFCHHCSQSGFQGVSQLGRARSNLAGTLRALEDEQDSERSAAGTATGSTSVQYPRAATFKPEGWPRQVIDWYRKYGITDTEVVEYGFAYVPSLYGDDRLVLPCYSNGTLVGYQLRGWGGEGSPKYLSVFAKQQGVRRIFDSGQAPHGLTLPSVIGRGPVVIVEDVLSAVKVGRQARAIACLTSTLDSGTLLSLRSDGHEECIIWLDNDNPDVNRKARELYRHAGLLFPSTRFVTGYSDPKNYDDATIRGVLNA